MLSRDDREKGWWGAIGHWVLGITAAHWHRNKGQETSLLHLRPLPSAVCLAVLCRHTIITPAGLGIKWRHCWRIKSNSILLAWTLEFSLKWPWVWWERNSGNRDQVLYILPGKTTKGPLSERAFFLGLKQSCHTCFSKCFSHGISLQICEEWGV